MDWRLVTEFFASIGYGLLSAFVPVFNSEVYIVAAQAIGRAAEVTTAVGVAIGQTIGKTAIVLAMRNGTKIPWLARQVDRVSERARRTTRAGRVRTVIRGWSKRLLELVGHPRWGPLIVFVAGLCAVPPIFAVQFLVPATKMPVWLFAVALFVGRCLLFLAIAFGASAIVEWLLP